MTRRRSSGWAKRLCRRVCLTAAKNGRRDRDRFVEDEVGVAGAATLMPDPLAAVEHDEMRVRVRSALERVPDDQRQLLMLRYWYGLGAVDIARRLDVPAATVRTKLRRARLRLRRAPGIVLLRAASSFVVVSANRTRFSWWAPMATSGTQTTRLN